MRAREGLRRAYLDEHVGTNIPVACRTYAAEFGAGARGRLSQRRRAAMQEHLSHCSSCRDLFTELTELNSRLGAILTPAALAAASSALGSAKRAAILRTSLTGHWRTWRWHPVTTVTGAAAGVAVAGGMLLAVNVAPIPGTPARAAVQPAAAPPGPSVRKREPGGGGAGGGAGSTAQSGPGSLASAGSPGGAAPSTPPADSAPRVPAADPTQASQPRSSGGTIVTSAPGNLSRTIASTAGATVTGLASTVGGAVTGLANTAGATVSGLTNTAGATVTGVTNAASSLVSTTTNAVTGVASTAGGTVAAAGSAVSSPASTAVTAPAVTASTAATGTASTVAAAATGLSSAAAANL
jgi:Putative zinc-finger